MNVRIYPGAAAGSVAAPTSKSMAHRLLICAGLSEGTSVIRGVSDCEDVQATLDCLRSVGADCRQEGDVATVCGVDITRAAPQSSLCCRESGSTLRFLIPSLLLTGQEVTFTGYGRLMERPMTVYEKLFAERGITFTRGSGSLSVNGLLPAGHYAVAGNVSSQFISGLLFALPLADGDSVIELIPPVESRSYILMTLDAMKSFGVEVSRDGENRLLLKGGQRYRPQEVCVEGDHSNAAFLDAFNFIGGDTRVTGLKQDSLQGDRCYRAALEALQGGHAVISLGDCPDLGPILFAVAAALHGGVFTETERLRIKESDRVEAMRQELGKCGITLLAERDRVEIRAGGLHAPTQPINGHNDHRIVMAMSVLLTLVGGEITGAEAVRKSYPAFFNDLSTIGIRWECLRL